MLVTFDVESEVAMAGRAPVNTEDLVPWLLERGYPGLRASLLEESCCSQPTIKQSGRRAECPSVRSERGLEKKALQTGRGAARLSRHAGGRCGRVRGPRSWLFKGLVKDLALPSALFRG